MAPAIAHFLVGAAILLFLATPFVLRFDLEREHAIWLIPLGGIWGIAPDVHHIAPIYADTLYAMHNSPWADLFGLHYTLDRPAVRARYHASVFGSILLFIGSVGAFWIVGRFRSGHLATYSPFKRAVVRILAVLMASGMATFMLFVTVSVQEGFPTVAGLVGSSSVLVGMLLTVIGGFILGGCWALVLESLLDESRITTPLMTALLGGVLGILAWVGGVLIGVPIYFGTEIPFVHWGSLPAFVIYGLVSGGCYGLVSGALDGAVSRTGDSVMGTST